MNIVIPFIRQAQSTPDAAALHANGQTLTYRQLLQQVRTFASGIAASGVGAGDKAAIVAGQAQTVAGTLALAWLGAVSVELAGSPDALTARCELASVQHVFHSASLDDATLPGVKQTPISVAFERGAAAPPPPVHVSAPSDAWHIAFSSGTTGRPKGIVLSHQNSLVNAHLQRTLYDTREGDCLLVGMNAGMGFSIHNWLRFLHTGGSIALGAMVVADMWKALHELPVTHMSMPVGAASRMADLIRAKGDVPRPPRLRAVTLGGAKLPPQLRTALESLLCANIVVHYGATETALVASLDSATAARFPHSAGRIAPWVQAQALDEGGRPLPPGKPGRLRFRSPAIAQGYLAPASDEQRAAFADGWFLSNDVGTVGPDGMLRLGGRTNDVINIAGVKIDPDEVEQEILRDPAIMECAVVDLPDQRGQPFLAAAVVAPGASVDVAALRARTASRGPQGTPRLVVPLQVIPRNEAGKVMRDVLRKAIRDAYAEQASKAPS